MITIIGSLNLDLVTYTKEAPKAGETVQGDFFEEHLGGKGMNECIATARLSTENKRNQVRMWGCLGDDRQAGLFLSELRSLNVDTSLLKQISGVRTGTASITVEETNGENRIIIVSGANGYLRPSEADLASAFDPNALKGEYVVLQNEFPEPSKVINWLAKNRPEVVKFYNPSPLKPEMMDMTILNKVEYLIVNRGEAWSIVKDIKGENSHQGGEKDENELLISRLREFLDKPTLIVTLGSKGCIYSVSGQKPAEYGFVASRKVTNIVDTTGAGDTFLGAIVARLYDGASIVEALQFATAASSLAIQRKGAVEGIPIYSSVHEIMD
ncbi:RBK1 [Brettanomyces bruxellensis]|uniref:Ribokinase n=1 Tax=Dekkera bruxellensis TaxID=5007 RepID=A0A7D9CYP2_DEKBR|nr:RBK1 [Brettanomyces bruxellensis]